MFFSVYIYDSEMENMEQNLTLRFYRYIQSETQ